MENRVNLPDTVCEKSPLINDDTNHTIVNITDVNITEAENTLSNTHFNYNLEHFSCQQKSISGETFLADIPKDIFNYITSYLPYSPDLVNFSYVSKKLNKKIKEETERGKLSVTLANLQPCFLSRSASFILDPHDYSFESWIHAAASWIVTAGSSAGGAVVGVYELNKIYPGRALERIALGSFVGGGFGSALGSFISSFFNLGGYNQILVPVVAIIGSGSGAAGMSSKVTGGDIIIGGLAGAAGAAGGMVGGILPTIAGTLLGFFARQKNAEYLQDMVNQRQEIKNKILLSR